MRPTIASIRKTEAEFTSKTIYPSVKKILTTHKLDDAIPHLKKILHTLIVLPMSSVDCERGFSVLKLIKTRLRNLMGAANLNHAMMVAIEGPPVREFNFKKAVTTFKRGANRRVY